MEKCDLIAKFIRSIAKQKTVIDSFDEKLFVAVVDHATVYCNDSISFNLINGSEIDITNHRTIGL